MSDRSPQDQDKYVLRFPDGMRDTLKRLAAEKNRSLNSEIVARLEESLTAERDVSDLYKLLEQTYDERRELFDTIHSKDVALQTVRRSHKDLVTIAKQLGQLFLDHSKDQPDFLLVLAQTLADFEIEDDGEASNPVESFDFDQYPPDPHEEVQRRRALQLGDEDDARVARKNKP